MCEEVCGRCGKSLKNGKICSMFDTAWICLYCKDVERNHPDYSTAVKAESDALHRGDRNFPGIGYPGKNGRVK